MIITCEVKHRVASPKESSSNHLFFTAYVGWNEFVQFKEFEM